MSSSIAAHDIAGIMCVCRIEGDGTFEFLGPEGLKRIGLEEAKIESHEMFHLSHLTEFRVST